MAKAAVARKVHVAHRKWKPSRLESTTWEAALDRTRAAFTQFDSCFVSFSGGKDSTVVLNLALIVAEELDRFPIRVVFWDEEAIAYETEDYCRRVADDPRVEMEWLCLPCQQRNACSREHPFWWPWAAEDEERWVRPLPPEAITTCDGFPFDPPMGRPTIPEMVGLICPVEKYGTVGELMGIRADESMVRRGAVGNDRFENFIIPAQLHDGRPNVFKVYPIYDMNTEDVWTAPATFGWDYNPSYDLMEMAGVPHFAQRCAPPYGEQPMQRLWTWKSCFPDIWEKMADRVPGASTAALYSRTELYSFNDVPEPPEGVTWQQFLHHRLEEYEDPLRSFIVKRVHDEIRRHYKMTSDPIVSAPHPVSGLGWRFIYLLADRGDLKNRRRGFYEELDSPKGRAMAEEYDAVRAIECPE